MHPCSWHRVQRHQPAAHPVLQVGTCFPGKIAAKLRSFFVLTPARSTIVSLHADHSIVTSRSQDDMTLESQRDGEPALLFHWSSPTFNKVCVLPRQHRHRTPSHFSRAPAADSRRLQRPQRTKRRSVERRSLRAARGYCSHCKAAGASMFLACDAVARAALAKGGTAHGPRPHYV